jgi:predicted porin
MKKQFMKTTALVGAALIGGAGAAAQAQTNKPVISVGGYYEGDIGLPLKNRADDTATLDYHAESEVHFNGSVKLDNGVSIRVRWELEGDGDGTPSPNRAPHSHPVPGVTAPVAGVVLGEGQTVAGSTTVPGRETNQERTNSLQGLDPLDEVYMTISGSFGQLILGSTDNAPTKMVTGYMGSWATGVAQNHAFDSFEWTETPSGSFQTTRNSRANSFDDDAEKISYFTPRISGVQLGFSYTPNDVQQTTEDAGAQADGATRIHDGFAFGANWTGKFEAASVGVAGGYVTFQKPENVGGDNATLWTAALKIDAGPVRLAGGYKAVNDGTSGTPDGQMFDLGIRYTMGPNRMSLTYTNGSEDANNDKTQAAMLGYARTLGPGTRWHANLIYNRGRATRIDNNAQTVTVTRDSGWAVSTGVRVNF